MVSRMLNGVRREVDGVGGLTKGGDKVYLAWSALPTAREGVLILWDGLQPKQARRLTHTSHRWCWGVVLGRRTEG